MPGFGQTDLNGRGSYPSHRPSEPSDHGADVRSTALLTDRYELTMLDAALRDGTAARPCVFEVFARELPAGRRYGVFAGLGRVVEALAAFRFGDAELSWLDDAGVVSTPTLRWLADYRFDGDVVAYREGELYLPGSPVLTVVAPFGHAVLLETLVLSILNYDSAVASAAARMVSAAGDRSIMEFGGRRTHEEAAVAAARASWIAGFASTSSLEAGRRYGLPTSGTAAHAFVLVHDDERAAFRSQLDASTDGTTLLVDTFDTFEGITNAIAVADGRMRAVRIDSGDLARHARSARAALDAAGFADTRIVVSGDLDEYALRDLATAPIDAYGVGTSVVTGSGAPTAGFVYKLVAVRDDAHGTWRPVAKAGGTKATHGGRKRASRQLAEGVAVAELLTEWGAPVGQDARPLQVPVIEAGEPVDDNDLESTRRHHRRAINELAVQARGLDPGPPAIPTIRADSDVTVPVIS